jgi:hypothetical protein
MQGFFIGAGGGKAIGQPLRRTLQQLYAFQPLNAFVWIIIG